MLKRPDAANLTRPGRAYFQVGNNEIFELFQAAWGGAPYTPGGFVAHDPEEIVEISLDGRRRPLGISAGQTSASTSGVTQLQALVSHIHDVAMREGIERLPGPWLPPLPEQVSLDTLRSPGGWDGYDWRPESAPD